MVKWDRKEHKNCGNHLYKPPNCGDFIDGSWLVRSLWTDKLLYAKDLMGGRKEVIRINLLNREEVDILCEFDKMIGLFDKFGL